VDLLGTLREAIAQAQAASSAWQGKITQPEDEKAWITPWMPFNLFDFGTMLLEACPWADGPRLLEIGCGPGSCLMLARALGWDARGIEINDEMTAAARSAGLDVIACDALEFGGYGDCDAVWFNRVFRNRGAQERLEAKLWREMAPGAVILCANLQHPPPPEWIIVSDMWDDLRRGVWCKPPAGTPGAHGPLTGAPYRCSVVLTRSRPQVPVTGWARTEPGRSPVHCPGDLAWPADRPRPGWPQQSWRWPARRHERNLEAAEAPRPARAGEPGQNRSPGVPADAGRAARCVHRLGMP